MWKIFSYSEIKFPLKPFGREYILGIVENENHKKLIVHINKEYVSEIHIGVKGKLNQVDGPTGIISEFTPSLKKKKEKVKKVALVTGSSSGIGREIALEMSKIGFLVLVNSNLNRKGGMETVEKIKKLGGEGFYIQCDVSNLKEVEKMMKQIKEKIGRIDVLVNNAGLLIDKKLENMTTDQWEKVISTNLTSVFNCSKGVIDLMKEQDGGKIINISSVIGQRGNFGQANYAAAKSGVIAFTKSIAKELASRNILVNAVAPGLIKTRMLESIPEEILKKMISQIPLGRLGQPEEVAKLVGFLASENSNYITGQVFNINGGFYM